MQDLYQETKKLVKLASLMPKTMRLEKPCKLCAFEAL